MPIYEYECLDCGKAFDRMQKMSDKPMTNCPVCNGKVIKRVSLPVVHIRAKIDVGRRLLPELSGGRSALDGTRPLDWPRGRLVGIKKEDADNS